MTYPGQIQTLQCFFTRWK